MGQGTESCGGHDADYDVYEEGLLTGLWTQRDGTSISLSKMTLRHLRGARHAAERGAERANFTSDKEKFEAWVDMFTEEIRLRSQEEKLPAKYFDGSVKAETRGAKAQMVCHCGCVYLAREADLKRGWAKSCSKRCAAIRRDFGRPASKRVAITETKGDST